MLSHKKFFLESFSHPFTFRILLLFASCCFSYPFHNHCNHNYDGTLGLLMHLSNASIYRGTLAIPSVEAPSTVRRIDFHHTASNSHEDVSLFNACVDALIQSEDIILESSFKGEKFLFDNTIDIVNMHFKDQHHFCKILPNGNKVNFSKPLEGD